MGTERVAGGDSKAERELEEWLAGVFERKKNEKDPKDPKDEK